MPSKLRKRFIDLVKFIIIGNRFKLIKSDETCLKQIECKVEKYYQAIFAKNPSSRTDEELGECLKLVASLHDMHRFEGMNLRELARECYYINARPGRMFMRMMKRPERVYFVLSGHVLLVVNYIVEHATEGERLTTQLDPGDSFGGFSMFLDQMRTESARALTNCELLYITRETFERLVRRHMQRHYDDVEKALTKVHLLKGLDVRNLHEFIYFGNILHFNAGEIVMSETSNVAKSFFLLEGECKLIEVLDLVRTDPDKLVLSSSISQRFRSTDLLSPTQSSDKSSQELKNSLQALLSPGASTKDVRMDANPMRAILQGHYGTVDNSKLANLMDAYIRISNQGDLFIEPHFMQICDYKKNGFFNIGEAMDNRCVVANTKMKVLAVPKQVLLNKKLLVHSKALRSLRSLLPTSAQVYRIFQQHRRGRKCRKNLIERLDWPKYISNSFSNIPFCTRVASDYEFTEEQARVRHRIWQLT